MTDLCISKGKNGLTYAWDDTKKSFAIISMSYIAPDKVPGEVTIDLMHNLTALNIATAGYPGDGEVDTTI